MTKPKDTTLTSMKAYHYSVDWTEYWEEFYLTIEKDGRPKYKSVAKFASAKANNAKQREFLKWYLGKPGDNAQLDEEYKFAKPQDWLYKRETGGWYTRANLDLASKEIRQKINALDALREAGNGVVLRMLARVDHLANKLDEVFQGELFVPGKTEAENYARTRTYFALHDDLMKMTEKALLMYAKSHGIDFEHLEGFSSLIAASASTQKENTQATNRLSQAMEQIVSMALIKSGKYGTPLPPSVKDKLIEASALPPIPEKKGNRIV